tara:strand:+ start:335 stop:604 length:270 start_codon:yes stop_codon:yes gene_type:complete
MIYPEMPHYGKIDINNLPQLFLDLVRYTSELKLLLEQRDTQVDLRPAKNIFTVTTVSNISRPLEGDLSYSTSTGKFRGYVSGTGWSDLN